jgi:hypothetical protein
MREPSHLTTPVAELERLLRPLDLGNSPCCDAPFVARYDDCGCIYAGCPKCGDDTYPYRECARHNWLEGPEK